MAAQDITTQTIDMDSYLTYVEPDTIRVKGHRIGLEHIVERYQEGSSAEQIAQEFPGVELSAVYAIIAYYLHNQAAVDAYIIRRNAAAEARYREWAALPSSPATQRVQELKANRRRELP